MIFRRLLLSIICLELFLGGGGRLVDIGVLSLRMYLFIFGLLITFFYYLLGKQLSRDSLFIVLIGIAFLIFSSVVGVMNGADISMVLNDVKPLLFLFSIFIFNTLLRTREDIDLVVGLVKTSAVLLAVIYILIFIGINTGYLSFINFYKLVEPTQEFFFRGEFAFFYKGFMYLCIGFIFVFFTPTKRRKLVMALLLGAVILTFTRGFILAILAVMLIYYLFLRVRLVNIFVIVPFIIGAVIFGWSYINSSDRIDRGKSDGDRITQIEEVINSITLRSAFIGHGFGNGTPSRPEHMEISYLEIFHKQGILGLSLWTIIFIYGYFLYKKASSLSSLATPFFLSLLLVFVQSLTNPFLNNPIGLAMVMISITVLEILAKEKNYITY